MFPTYRANFLIDTSIQQRVNTMKTNTINRIATPALVALMSLGLVAGCASAPLANDTNGGRLAAEQNRITDSVIAGDLATIRALNGRLENLNTGGLRNANYHMTKARNWIDFAFEEYNDNDRSVVTEAALAEAAVLIRAMEANEKDITMDTPIIRTSRKIRPDLWELSERLKRGEGFRCAQTTLAEFEVQLVWSGHEYEELGWRHAVAEIDRAERLADQAVKEYENCGKVVSPVQCPVCPAIPSPPIVPANDAALQMPKRVHFAFDSAAISGESRRVMREVVRVMNRSPQITLLIEGNTDAYGSVEYNRNLARRRVDAVRKYLRDSGVSGAKIETAIRGEFNLLSDECTPVSHARNRRVDFIVVNAAGEEIRLFDQEEDLQLYRLQHNCGSKNK